MTWPLYLWANNPWHPLRRRLGGPHWWALYFCRRKKFLASTGNQTLDHPGHSAVSAPTMLSRKSEII